MIPIEILGNPVRYFLQIDPPRYPRGYPLDGDLEKTTGFLISISDEGNLDDERFWVSCVSESGRIMAGEMCYSLHTAKEFPATVFDVDALSWIKLESP